MNAQIAENIVTEKKIADHPSAASKSQDETVPLKITVTTDSGAYQYFEQTKDATLDALRADILHGMIPREAKAVFETRIGTGKPSLRQGTLIKGALSYPLLADLYTPVRRHARAGMGYGILAGVLLNIACLGLAIFQVNQTFGAVIIALPVSYLLFHLRAASKIKLPGIIELACTLAPIIIPWYLGANGLFAMVLGAATAGGVLGSMPGMVIGAIVGVVRRPRLPRAFDAPRESAVLRIAVPLVIGVVVWTAYLLWAWSYLQARMK